MSYSLRSPRRHVVIVTGSRDWTDERAVGERLARYPRGTLVIHGHASGADTCAHFVAAELGMRVLSEAYFGDLGKAGGPARNALLAALGHVYAHHGYVVTVEAFPLPSSRGTWDMLKQTRALGLEDHVDRRYL